MRLYLVDYGKGVAQMVPSIILHVIYAHLRVCTFFSLYP